LLQINLMHIYSYQNQLHFKKIAIFMVWQYRVALLTCRQPLHTAKNPQKIQPILNLIKAFEVQQHSNLNFVTTLFLCF